MHCTGPMPGTVHQCLRNTLYGVMFTADIHRAFLKWRVSLAQFIGINGKFVSNVKHAFLVSG